MKLRAYFLKAIYPIAALYWKLRPYGQAVRTVVWHEGKIALVMHTYGPKLWALPGGGIKWGEDPLMAAKREVWEEVGIHLANIESYAQNPIARTNNGKLWVYQAQSPSNQAIPDKVEIAEVRWFEISEIPDALAAQSKLALLTLDIK